MNDLLKSIKIATERLVKEYKVKDVYITISETLDGKKEISVTVEV